MKVERHKARAQTRRNWMQRTDAVTGQGKSLCKVKMHQKAKEVTN